MTCAGEEDASNIHRFFYAAEMKEETSGNGIAGSLGFRAPLGVLMPPGYSC